VVATYSAEEIIELTGARMACGMLPDEVGEVATDTRADLAGAWFVALCGKTFDGHDFIGDAFSAGALGCIVADRPSYPIAATSFPLLAVDDTEEALGKLARNWRRRTRKKLILVAATSLNEVSKMALAVYEELDRALLLHTSEVPSSGDFSAPAVAVSEQGIQLSTQFSLDPSAAFPTSQTFECTEAAQSFLANWKINVSEILSRFLNLPDEVEYIVADFSPLPLDRARFIIECLSPNALILSRDSFEYARLSLPDEGLLRFKIDLVEAVKAGKGQVYSTNAGLAEKLEVNLIHCPEATITRPLEIGESAEAIDKAADAAVVNFDDEPEEEIESGYFSEVFRQFGV
jgi:hypothetical protein